MREIVLDTETTGLDAAGGDRIVEIGCIELLNGIATGQTFHVYLNPRRAMPEEAFRIHGLSDAFLADKAAFEDEAERFLDFVGGDPLVIHNADFDIGFINHELKRMALPAILMTRVVDTLALARRRHPGAPNSLNALCARFRIDNTKRVKHGALLDAELLAEVYAELVGGRQTSLALAHDAIDYRFSAPPTARRPVPLPSRLTEAQKAAHLAFIATMTAPLWFDYIDRPAVPVAAE